MEKQAIGNGRPYNTKIRCIYIMANYDRNRLNEQASERTKRKKWESSEKKTDRKIIANERKIVKYELVEIQSAGEWPAYC